MFRIAVFSNLVGFMYSNTVTAGPDMKEILVQLRFVIFQIRNAALC